MRFSRAILLVALLFVLTLLVRLPAGWALALLPPRVQCMQPGGTVWNGQCTRLQVDGIVWNGVRWQLHAVQLLKAVVDVSLQSADPSAPGRANLSWQTDDTLTVTNLMLHVPASLSAQLLPSGWTGTLSLDVARALIQQQHITGLLGSATLQGLKLATPPLELGGVQVSFPAQPDGDTLHGAFTDQGGPLMISGDVQLQPAGRYEVHGVVSARAGTDDNLRNMLGLLGAADAQGRHMFSLSGTY